VEVIIEAFESKYGRRKTLPPTDIACTWNTNESSQYDGVESQTESDSNDFIMPSVNNQG
jgi:hypothetical protein